MSELWQAMYLDRWEMWVGIIILSVLGVIGCVYPRLPIPPRRDP